MTDRIIVEKVNEVHMKVLTEPSILQELSEFFAFRPPNYQFNPKYKARIWDGYIRMITPFKPILYIGLIELLRQFCETREYELITRDGIGGSIKDVQDSYGYDLAADLKTPFQPRDYQNKYIVNAIRTGRSLSLSPTSSGKSYMQYLVVRHYLDLYQYRSLIIVPTISLVHQMAGDFEDYGFDPDLIHKIQGGVDKNSKKPVTVSTWQSLQKQPREWFDQFRVVMGDEAHLFTAGSLKGIMEKCTDTPYRFGWTGTIGSDSKTHHLMLQCLFGPIVKYVSTKDLIDEESVASLEIKALKLNYSEEIKKQFRINIKKLQKEKKYHAEREFITQNAKRNLFIKNLVWSQKNKNNLILFELVEKHGKILEPMLECDDRTLHFIHGGTSGDERERIRHLVENDPNKNHDILASFGTFSTGVSIKRIDNLILASGSKSEIRILQSIGRSLRRGNGSDHATIFDLGDDLSKGSYKNYTLEHFKKRLEIYSSEQFPFKLYNIDLN